MEKVYETLYNNNFDDINELRKYKQDVFTFIKQNNYKILNELFSITNLSYHTNDIEFDMGLNMSVEMAMTLPMLPYSICYDAIRYKKYKLLDYAL